MPSVRPAHTAHGRLGRPYPRKPQVAVADSGGGPWAAMLINIEAENAQSRLTIHNLFTFTMPDIIEDVFCPCWRRNAPEADDKRRAPCSLYMKWFLARKPLDASTRKWRRLAARSWRSMERRHKLVYRDLFSRSDDDQLCIHTGDRVEYDSLDSLIDSLAIMDPQAGSSPAPEGSFVNLGRKSEVSSLGTSPWSSAPVTPFEAPLAEFEEEYLSYRSAAASDWDVLEQDDFTALGFASQEDDVLNKSF